MDAQHALQKILRIKLSDMQRANARVSMRAFATKAGLSAGALSAILAGKRIVSKKIYARISESLPLDPQERSTLDPAFLAPPVKSKEALKFRKLSSAQFRMMSDWEHLAILSLAQTVDFDPRPEAIAARLGLKVQKIETALEHLLDLGLLQKRKGKMLRLSEPVRSTDDIPSGAIREFHDQTLQLAQKSLHHNSVEQRDFCATTFPFRPTDLPAVKSAIRRFHDDLSAIGKAEDGTEVYRFSSQFFPLTNILESRSIK